ncbi:hypothetical protein T492DRAFT_907593 [Pavlovales sp. CCMP2436]|nr:hypothetical protein T492DRAFT_907593 [Pavlovales sp. CCMP2436]
MINPNFAAHSHILKQAIKSAQTPAAARSAAVVEQLTTPGREKRDVAVTLSWAGGGSSIFLVGSFTNWVEHVPMMVAAEGNMHVVTVHLRAGEHHYLFEVDGVLCVADEEPMTSVLPGCTPAGWSRWCIVNTVVVDDGSEYEDGKAAAARPVSPTEITAPFSSTRTGADGFSTTVPADLQVMWGEPPALPATLARMHGVPQTAASCRIRRIIWPEGRPHADFADCALLNHAASARCDDARISQPDSGCSDVGLLPEMGKPAISVSVTSRWRAHRVTNVLLKPAPARSALLSDITSRRTLEATHREAPLAR